jgi:hypothetical protein
LSEQPVAKLLTSERPAGVVLSGKMPQLVDPLLALHEALY